MSIYLSGDDREILAELGLNSADELFGSIPQNVKEPTAARMDPPLTERQIKTELQKREAGCFSGSRFAQQTGTPANDFTGFGAYRHYIPEAVHHLASQRGFVTAYTPYQPEVAQGMLQALFEYQSMMAELASMDLANGSLYDGATAMVEAIRMALRQNPPQKEKKGEKRIVAVSQGVHPHIRQVMETYFPAAVSEELNIEIIIAPLDPKTGDTNWLAAFPDTEPDIAVLQSPNYLGVTEQSATHIRERFTNATICYGTLEPLALALLPGTPASLGAEIVWGEAQSLGMPLSFGGPGLGFMACTEKYMRQMPGRLIGQTEAVDSKGDRTAAYVITLATREQHIRREKATSNICSNQTLMAIRAAIYMASYGWKGMQTTALDCRNNARYFIEHLTPEAGTPLFSNADYFHEVAWKPANMDRFEKRCSEMQIAPGKKVEINGEEVMLTYFSELQDHDSIHRLIEAAV